MKSKKHNRNEKKEETDEVDPIDFETSNDSKEITNKLPIVKLERSVTMSLPDVAESPFKRKRISTVYSEWRNKQDIAPGIVSANGTRCNAVVCSVNASSYNKKNKAGFMESKKLFVFTVMIDDTVDVAIPHKPSISEEKENKVISYINLSDKTKFPILEKRKDIILSPGSIFSFTCFNEVSAVDITVGGYIEITKLNYGINIVTKLREQKKDQQYNFSSSTENDELQNEKNNFDTLGSANISFTGIPVFKYKLEYNELRDKVKNSKLPRNLEGYLNKPLPFPEEAKVPDEYYFCLPNKQSTEVKELTGTLIDYDSFSDKNTSSTKSFQAPPENLPYSTLTCRYFLSKVSNEILLSHSYSTKGVWVEMVNYLDYFGDGLPNDLIAGGPPIICMKAPEVVDISEMKNPYRFKDKETQLDKLCIRGKEDKFICGNTETDDSGFTFFQMALYSIPEKFGIADVNGWLSICKQMFMCTRALCFMQVNEASTINGNKDMIVQGSNDIEFVQYNAPKIFVRPELIIDYETTLKWCGLEIGREFALSIIEKKLNRAQGNKNNSGDGVVKGRVIERNNPNVLIANSVDAQKSSWWLAAFDFTGNIQKTFNENCRFFAIPPNNYLSLYENLDHYPTSDGEYLNTFNIIAKNTKEDFIESNNKEVKSMIEKMGIDHKLEIYVLHLKKKS